MTVKVDFSGMDKIIQAMSDPGLHKQCGDMTLGMCKDFISKGISPVLGEGRFVGYKDPKSYPAGAKTIRPVNLFLSGDMLASINVNATSEGFSIGIDDDAQSRKALGNMKTRPFLPIVSGQDFNVSIKQAIIDFYAKALNNVI